DPGLLKSREHRVQGRATWVSFHHLPEGLIGAPANGRAIEGFLNLLERAFAEPARQHRRDGLTSLEAVALPGQVDVEQRFDHRAFRNRVRMRHRGSCRWTAGPRR